jgi:hypothetical protein
MNRFTITGVNVLIRAITISSAAFDTLIVATQPVTKEIQEYNFNISIQGNRES